MNHPGDYTPEIIATQGMTVYAKVILQLLCCAICKKVMVDSPQAGRLPFPHSYQNNLEAQMKRAGWVARSGVVDKDHDPICVNCCVEEKATIVCALCGQERPSSQEKASFGDPPEYLCQLCYETIPAATWEAKVETLSEAHKWDWE